MNTSVTEYQDYRLFLSDFFHSKKRTHRGWSLAIWKRHLGLQSVSSLSMILKGQRHPSKKLVLSLCQFFKFSERESKYFQTLVDIQKRAHSVDMTLLLTKSKDTLQSLNPVKEASRLQEDLLLNKLTHILREMAEIENFSRDSSWIKKALNERYSLAPIENQIQDLLMAGLLKEENNCLKSIEVNIKSNKPSVEKLNKFHKEILEETVQALPLVDENDRAFYVSFLNVRKDKLLLAKKLLREFQSEFNNLVEDKPGEEVYQLSMQFVPVTNCSDKVQ